MNYYWIPFKDEGWREDIARRRMSHGDRILPYVNGKSAEYASRSAYGDTWSSIVENDTIFIGAHGRKYTTTQVGWKVKEKLVYWDAQLASALAYQLAGKKEAKLDIHILACWSANNMTLFSSCFGSKLASALKSCGIRGKLTAYKGVIGMDGASGHQSGSSRITSGMYLKFNDFNVKGNLTEDAAKSWPLHD